VAKVLVVDSGGRGNAIAHAFSRSPQVSRVYVAPGNAGSSIFDKCQQVPIKSIDEIVRFGESEKVDLVFIGPESYLSSGVVDACMAVGLKSIGPTKRAAILESSKCDTKDFLDDIKVPVPDYENFDDPENAKDFVRSYVQEGNKVVVKADGLANGKGSIVCDGLDDALCAIDQLMVQKVFGDAGNRVIIEKRIYGKELSFFVVTDGYTILPLESAQDYKRRFSDSDKSSLQEFDPKQGYNPNTGGMGGYSPHPWLDSTLREKIMQRIALPTILRMEERFGVKYAGIAYFGLMICEEEHLTPYVLEVNIRMGDPEAQVILPRLNSDVYELSHSMIGGTLSGASLEWDPSFCLGVCAVSGRLRKRGKGLYRGYPGRYASGLAITGLENVPSDILVYHNGTRSDNGTMLTTGGRVLTFAAKRDSLQLAKEEVYGAVQNVHFDGMSFRKDIGI